jgi:hypothetical protein
VAVEVGRVGDRDGEGVVVDEKVVIGGFGKESTPGVDLGIVEPDGTGGDDGIGGVEWEDELVLAVTALDW